MVKMNHLLQVRATLTPPFALLLWIFSSHARRQKSKKRHVIYQNITVVNYLHRSNFSSVARRDDQAAFVPAMLLMQHDRLPPFASSC